MIHVTPGGRGLGWTGPSPADPRDYRYTPAPEVLANLPTSTSNQQRHPSWLLPQADEQQLQEGSCTAWAMRKLAFWAYNQAGWHGAFPPSARAIYYCERQILEAPPYNLPNATQQDTGGFSRAVIQATATYGICADHWAPYAVDGNPLDYVAIAPDPAAYVNMHKHLTLSYHQVAQTRQNMQAALAAGHPWIFGFTVHASFESATAAQTGRVPMPTANDPVIGGHEMFGIDYFLDGGEPYYTVLGSWGLYGDQGRMYFPAAYLEDPTLASDFWVVIKQT